MWQGRSFRVWRKDTQKALIKIKRTEKILGSFFIFLPCFDKFFICSVIKSNKKHGYTKGGKKKFPQILKQKKCTAIQWLYFYKPKIYVWPFIWVTSTHFTNKELFFITLRRMTENRIIDYWKFDVLSSCLKILLIHSMILGVRIVINLREPTFKDKCTPFVTHTSLA